MSAKYLLLALLGFHGAFAGAHGRSAPDAQTLVCHDREQDSVTCMLCVVVSEARNQKFEGKVEVGRTIKTRMSEKGYPKSVCGNAYSGAFDGLNGGPKTFVMNLDEYVTDVEAAKQALIEPGNGFDHYLNPRTASDFSWYRKCKNKTPVLDHVFCQLGPIESEELEDERSIRQDTSRSEEVPDPIAEVLTLYR